MSHTIDDIVELAEYHLVASAPDDEVAQHNLERLVHRLELLASRPLRTETTCPGRQRVEAPANECAACSANRANGLSEEEIARRHVQVRGTERGAA